MKKIIDKTQSLSHLISPRRDIETPVYNWHAFKHSYSKDLVSTFIKEFNLKKGSWVLDPFCGGGTTLLACKESGVNAHGFDILPFSVYLSNVKTRDYDGRILQSTRDSLFKKTTCGAQISLPSDIPIFNRAFAPNILKELVDLKVRVNRINEKKLSDFFNLAFLSILESVSNTSKSGGFLRIVNRNIRASAVRGIFEKQVDKMIADVDSVRSDRDVKIQTKAFLGDARSLPDGRKYDAILTSPPYPNRHDYTRIYSLEMMFDFISSNSEIKQIRYETLRSHVEARSKYQAIGYKTPKLLRQILKDVGKTELNNPMILTMIDGYFEDMFLVLHNMKRNLKANGRIALVVSNVRFGGVSIPVDQLLLELGKSVGLKPIGIWVARYRGNSSQQMRDFRRAPTRESVVLWQKG